MRLSDTLEPERLKQAFAKDGRLQISNFLSTESAAALLEACKNIPWRLVLNDGDNHFDISPEQLAALAQDKQKSLIHGAQVRSRTQFQYLFKNYPVADIAAGSGLSEGPVREIYDFMNSKVVLDLLNDVTATSSEFCDMQFTRYETGHFLTLHDDNISVKNRQFAYVLSLSPEWKSGWGGLLQFFKSRASNAVQKSFVPRFNTLSIFKVPTLHQVSRVEPHARVPRLSITGWYRKT